MTEIPPQPPTTADDRNTCVNCVHGLRCSDHPYPVKPSSPEDFADYQVQYPADASPFWSWVVVAWCLGIAVGFLVAYWSYQGEVDEIEDRHERQVQELRDQYQYDLQFGATDDA